jgi:hypothetical protein
MRVVTLGALGMQKGLGDFYTMHERGFNPLRQRAGYNPSFLPHYNPNMRSRGLGDLPGSTVGDARTYLSEIVVRLMDASVAEDVLQHIEDEVMAISGALGPDAARPLTIQERMAINRVDNKSYMAVGHWYRTSTFRYGLAALAVGAAVFVVYRSYR